MIIGGPDQRSSTDRNNRMFIEGRPGMCARVRRGANCRKRVANGTARSVVSVAEAPRASERRLFEARSRDRDFEYVIVDSGIVRARQHASGAKRGVQIRPSAVRAAA